MRYLQYLLYIFLFGGPLSGKSFDIEYDLKELKELAIEDLSFLLTTNTDSKKSISIIKHRISKHPRFINRFDEFNWVQTDLYKIRKLKKTLTEDEALELSGLNELEEKYQQMLDLNISK